MVLGRRSGRRRGPASLKNEIVLYHADDKMRFAHGSHEPIRKPDSVGSCAVWPGHATGAGGLKWVRPDLTTGRMGIAG